MSEFTLYYQGGVSVAVTVEADELEDAIDAGYQKLPGGLCHQCARQYDIGDLEFADDGYEVDGTFVDPTKALS